MTVSRTCTWVLLAGLPGTGKTTLATALAPLLSSAGFSNVVLNKDTIRAALFPGDATDYTAAQNDLCMEALLSSAGYLSATPEGPRYILMDGRTFSRREAIAQVTEAAKRCGAAYRILHLWCRDEIAIARISAQKDGHPAENRNAALYLSLQANLEPIEDAFLSVDMNRPLKLSLVECLRYLIA